MQNRVQQWKRDSENAGTSESAHSTVFNLDRVKKNNSRQRSLQKASSKGGRHGLDTVWPHSANSERPHHSPPSPISGDLGRGPSHQSHVLEHRDTYGQAQVCSKGRRGSRATPLMTLTWTVHVSRLFMGKFWPGNLSVFVFKNCHKMSIFFPRSLIVKYWIFHSPHLCWTSQPHFFSRSLIVKSYWIFHSPHLCWTSPPHFFLNQEQKYGNTQ